jgi:hypothetical protein
MYRCTYTICTFFSMLAFICIYIWITLTYKNIYTHTHNIILSRCLFFCCFVVVFIEMTILYTMIIVNSHLLHHFIPGPMIQELHIRWFLCIFDLIWFDLIFDWRMGWDLSVYLMIDRQIWYHQIMISVWLGYKPFVRECNLYQI